MPIQQTPRDQIPNTGWNSPFINTFRSEDRNALQKTFTSIKDYINRYVTQENQGCKAYRNAGVAILNNTFTAVDMNAEYWDTEDFHSNTTNPSRLTIPAGRKGKYSIVVSIDFAANGAGQRFIGIQKNGTAWLTYSAFPNFGLFNTIGSVSCVADLVAGDYVQAVAWQNSGGNLNVGNTGADTTSISIQYVAP